MESKKRLNNKILLSIGFYIILIGDVIINSYIAHKWFNGVPQINPSFKLFTLVINPISVFISFGIATVFLILGLIKN